MSFKVQVNDQLLLNEDFFNHHVDVDPKYIMQIISSNMPNYWSWGAHGATNLNGKGLRIAVNGLIHKGFVYIVVNGLDLFDVYLTDKKNTIKNILSMVYFDELAERLDAAIEHTGATYGQDLEKEAQRINAGLN